MRAKIAAALLAVALALTGSAGPALAHDRLDALTNRFRVAHERRALPTNAHLQELARERARRIFRTGLVHAFYWLDRTRCTTGGENIGYRIPAPEDPGLYAFRAFRASSVHRAMMLGRGWDRMASAIYRAPNGGIYFVQLFCDA